MNKVLRFILFVLTLIIITQIVYLTVSRQSSYLAQNTSPEHANNNTKVIPTRLPEEKILGLLNMDKKNSMADYYFVSVYSGNIGRLQYFENDGGYEIQLVDTKTNEEINFYLTKENADKVEVTIEENGEQLPAKFSDIKENDYVVITGRENLKNPKDVSDSYLIKR